MRYTKKYIILTLILGIFAIVESRDYVRDFEEVEKFRKKYNLIYKLFFFHFINFFFLIFNAYYQGIHNNELTHMSYAFRWVLSWFFKPNILLKNNCFK